MRLAACAIARRGAWGVLASWALGASGAYAEEAHDWQLGFQPAASVVREHIDFLHNVILLPIITVISLFVLIMVSSKASPEFTWKGALANAAVLIALCVGVFVYGLGLQFPVWPTLFN